LERGSCVTIVADLEQGRREIGRGEGQEVEGNEEELVKSATDEQEGLLRR
jgi:hypothetical protein